MTQAIVWNSKCIYNVVLAKFLNSRWFCDIEVISSFEEPQGFRYNPGFKIIFTCHVLGLDEDYSFANLVVSYHDEVIPPTDDFVQSLRIKYNNSNVIMIAGGIETSSLDYVQKNWLFYPATSFANYITMSNCPDNIDFVSDRPYLFDALLGGIKPHRVYVFNRLTEDNLLDKSLVSMSHTPYSRFFDHKYADLDYLQPVAAPVVTTAAAAPPLPAMFKGLSPAWVRSSTGRYGWSFGDGLVLDNGGNYIGRAPATENPKTSGSISPFTSPGLAELEEDIIKEYRPSWSGEIQKNAKLKHGPTTEQTGHTPRMSCIVPHKIYAASWFSIVCETQFDGAWFFTEKTFKPMFSHRVFVCFAAPGHLAQLKKLGFKTFDGIIDESYDAEPNNNKRANQVWQQVRRLATSDARSIYQQALPILEHNHRVLINLPYDNLSAIGDFVQDYLNKIN
jgi:hypothetical protein